MSADGLQDWFHQIFKLKSVPLYARNIFLRLLFQVSAAYSEQTEFLKQQKGLWWPQKHLEKRVNTGQLAPVDHLILWPLSARHLLLMMDRSLHTQFTCVLCSVLPRRDHCGIMLPPPTHSVQKHKPAAQLVLSQLLQEIHSNLSSSLPHGGETLCDKSCLYLNGDHILEVT